MHVLEHPQVAALRAEAMRQGYHYGGQEFPSGPAQALVLWGILADLLEDLCAEQNLILAARWLSLPLHQKFGPAPQLAEIMFGPIE